RAPALVRRLAGALEEASEHPIAKAVAAAAHAASAGPLPDVADFANHDGRGVSGNVDGHAVLVGRRSWLDAEWSQQPSSELIQAAEAAEAAGRSPVWVSWDSAIRGIVVVADTVKPTSAAAIAEFRRLGLRPVLLTGDNARAAD